MSARDSLPYEIPADMEDRRDEFVRANWNRIAGSRRIASKAAALEIGGLLALGLTFSAVMALSASAWLLLVGVIAMFVGFIVRGSALSDVEAREGKRESMGFERRIWYFQDLNTVTSGEIDSLGPRLAALRTETAEARATTEQLQLTVELERLKLVTLKAIAGEDVSGDTSPDLPVVNGASVAELELDLGPLAYETNTWKVIDHIEAELGKIEKMFREAEILADATMDYGLHRAEVVLGKRCATCMGGDHLAEDCIADVVEVYAWSSDRAVRTFAVPDPAIGKQSSLNPNDHSFFTQRGMFRGHPGL